MAKDAPLYLTPVGQGALKSLTAVDVQWVHSCSVGKVNQRLPIQVKQ